MYRLRGAHGLICGMIPTRSAAFHREALAATQLNDPHIVGVYDVGEKPRNAIHGNAIRQGDGPQGVH